MRRFVRLLRRLSKAFRFAHAGSKPMPAAAQAKADPDKSSPDTDNPLAFYSTVELFDEIGRRSSTLVCAYKPHVIEDGYTWAQVWRGDDFDAALGLSRRLWHSMDQDARRSSK